VGDFFRSAKTTPCKVEKRAWTGVLCAGPWLDMSGKTAPTDNDSRATQQAPDLARTMHVIDRSRDRPARFFGHNLVVASFHLL
ncbi:hypothetical protein ACO1MN_16045, partial [Staphylococcus aureus]